MQNFIIFMKMKTRFSVRERIASLAFCPVSTKRVRKINAQDREKLAYTEFIFPKQHKNAMFFKSSK